MAIEANGLPYNSNNPTGIGAIYLSPQVDVLEEQRRNLKELDGGDDFWKAYKLQQDADAKKAKLAADITKDLTVNPEGARPEDIQNDFIPAIQDIKDRYAKIVGKVGGNNSTLTRDPEFMELMSDKNALTSRILQSKEINKILVSDATKYDPAKHDDETLVALAKARGKNLEDATAFVSENGGTFLKPVAVDIQKPLEQSFANMAKTVYDVTDKPKPIGGQSFVEEIGVVNPKKLLGSAQAFVLNKAKDVDATWNNMPAESQRHYTDAAAIESQILGEEINPKEYYVYKFYKDRLGETKKLKGGQFTPERREGAKGVKDQDKADALYDLINGVTEINSDVYAKSDDGKPMAVNGKYITTNLGGYAIGSRQDNGATVPNLIIATRVDPANPNIIEVRTDKDAVDDPTGTKFGQKVAKDALLYNLAINNFSDPMQGLAMLKKAATRKKDVTGAGIISPTQTINAESPITPTWKQTPVQADIDPNTGLPVKKKAEPAKSAKVDYSKFPKSSDGKWYYDGKEWKAIK